MAIITISRGSLSGGAQLAKQLGERLGLKVISREVIVEAAKKYGVSETDLGEGLKSPPGLWDRLTNQKQRYILAIQAALAEMVKDDSVVYHGYGGQFLLKDLSRVIKLRLIAPLEYRVRAAMMELKLPREQAERHIHTIDEQRTKWVRLLYNVEWTDASLYDMVINLEHMSIETACEIVADMVGRSEYKTTAEIRQERRDFALAMRIKAELNFHSEVPADQVEVVVRRGVLHLEGQQFEKNRETILQQVRQIPYANEALPSPDEAGTAHGTADSTAEMKAKDVMLPIKDYPYIHQWISIREAIAALGTSSVKLHDGHVISPRYIMVHDEREQLVGVVTRRSLLKGLTPQLKQLEQTREQFEAIGAPVDNLNFPVTFRWLSLFSPAALASASEPVESIMRPIRCSVRPDEELSAVVTTMIQYEVDLVPVIDKHKPVGVVLMTDVFDTVARFIIEQGGKAEAGHDRPEAPPR